MYVFAYFLANKLAMYCFSMIVMLMMTKWICVGMGTEEK